MLLECSHLYKYYKNFCALSDVSFHINAGEIIGVVGESGSGKSTLLKIIAGLEKYSHGSLMLHGHPLTYQRNLEQKKALQLIFQNPQSSFNPRITFKNSLETVRHNLQSTRSLAEVLELVKIPYELLTRYPNEVSGGQCQRLALARCFLSEPQLMLCDEITSSLDTVAQKHVLDMLKHIQTKHNGAILLVTHDLGVAYQVCDRLIVLKDGVIVEQGRAYDIIHTPQHPYTQRLRSSVFQLS